MKSIKEILINIIKFIYNELPYSWVSFLWIIFGNYVVWTLLYTAVYLYKKYSFVGYIWDVVFFYTICLFKVLLVAFVVLILEAIFKFRIKNKLLRNSKVYRISMRVLLLPFFAFIAFHVGMFLISIPNLLSSLVEVIINHETYLGF